MRTHTERTPVVAMTMTPVGHGKGEIRSHTHTQLAHNLWIMSCYMNVFCFTSDLHFTFCYYPFPVFGLIKPSFRKLEIICVSQPNTVQVHIPVSQPPLWISSLCIAHREFPHTFINHMVNFMCMLYGPNASFPIFMAKYSERLHFGLFFLLKWMTGSGRLN